MPWLDDLDDPGDEEDDAPLTWFSACGILVDGQDPGALRRATIRKANARRQQAEVDRTARKGQERAERPQRATVPGKPALPLRGRSKLPVPGPERGHSGIHPAGLALLLDALR